MDKLKTREKIIIVIAVLGVLYAGYVYLIEPASKGKTKEQPQEISVPAITAPTENYEIADVATREYIIQRAEANWGKNPFLDRNSNSYKGWMAIERAAIGGTAAKIVYSGYIDAGIKKLAIINGFEYQAGDQLEADDYSVKQITPSQILLVNVKTGTEIEVPISE